MWNKKTLGLGSELRYLGIFGPQIKSFCHIWNQHSRTCKIAKFHPKQKNINLETKNTFSGNFRLEFEKKYFHIWNWDSQIRQNVKFHVKQKSKSPHLGAFGLQF